MKFYPLKASAEADKQSLQEEYKAGHEIGKLRLGEKRLYFRSMRKVYYIAYADIRRYFRRVMLVPAKMCCGRGNFQMEHLVLCGEEGELAQIELPGTKAAMVVMDSMKRLAPLAAAGKPGAEEGAKTP